MCIETNRLAILLPEKKFDSTQVILFDSRFLHIWFLSTKIFTHRHRIFYSLGKDNIGSAKSIKADTNVLIDICTSDKDMRYLANSINAQPGKLRTERHRFQQGHPELKHAVTNISHDLRTPLTAIRIYLELPEQEEKSETFNRYFEIIKDRDKTDSNAWSLRFIPRIF